jgi:polyribonucleotide nucleotidyltransferase
MNCAKAMVGRVIGKQGDTIKQLQRNTGANVQIDQSSDPCIITITGQTANINNAVRDINNIINDTGAGAGASGYGRGTTGAPLFSLERSQLAHGPPLMFQTLYILKHASFWVLGPIHLK